MNLAHGFDCQTIAEGVEDEQTLQLLRNYGVDFAQGFSRDDPLPSERRTVWSGARDVISGIPFCIDRRPCPPCACAQES